MTTATASSTRRASQYVTAVGGTTLSRRQPARLDGDGLVGASGSGCSAYEAKPSWQTDTGCSRRTVTDVSAVADPATGVAIYDTYGQGGWPRSAAPAWPRRSSPRIYALAGTRPPAATRRPTRTPTQLPQRRHHRHDGTCSPAYLCTAEVRLRRPDRLGHAERDGVVPLRAGVDAVAGRVEAPPPGIAAGSSPAVSSWGANRLDVFVRGADNAIWHVWWNGMTWSGWETQDTAGVAMSSPAAVSSGSDHIDLFAAGADGNLYQKTWNGVSWSLWKRPALRRLRE